MNVGMIMNLNVNVLLTFFFNLTLCALITFNKAEQI